MIGVENLLKRPHKGQLGVWNMRSQVECFRYDPPFAKNDTINSMGLVACVCATLQTITTEDEYIYPIERMRRLLSFD